MKLYLVRHGEALESNQDPLRPLSPKGRQDIEKLGRFLAHSNLRLFHLIHSGKLRAEETAEILAQKLHFENDLESRRGLDPLDDVTEIKEELSHYVNDILIVGHLPYLSRLISALLTDNENQDLVFFEPGALACLENISDERWILHYLLQPSLLPN